MSETLLDVWIDGVPPSKNRRTRMNTQTGRLYTEPSVREWMEQTAAQVRRDRKRSWSEGAEMRFHVVLNCSKKHMHKIDLDGILPCLIDAVCAGLVGDNERMRPPDQWVVGVEAWKVEGKEGALVFVEEYPKGGA